MFSKFSNQPSSSDADAAEALEGDLAETAQELNNAAIANRKETETSMGTAPKTDEAPESVKTVEKISGILSPYFIVVVGLILSDRNFFIGIVLITIGIFSLLKLSWQDVQGFIDRILAFFQAED